MNHAFRKLAQSVSHLAGSPWSFLFACFLVFGWAVTGPAFNYSADWQLFINTGTTILTFLMVFLIQNTQNRDSHAIHLKLDELIRSVKQARNELIDIEEDQDEKLEEYQKEFRNIRSTHANPKKENLGA